MLAIVLAAILVVVTSWHGLLLLCSSGTCLLLSSVYQKVA